MTPPRTFWLHINYFDAPYKRVWEVRQGGQRFVTTHVDCRVPVETVFRGLTRQPYAFLRGRGVVRQRGARIRITER